MGYYPIAVDLTDKKCLIVGAGMVALRKAQVLREAGALVTVIAPAAVSGLEGMDGVEVLHRAYQPGDVAGYTLVFIATDDRALNALIAKEAGQSGIPANVVDDPELCSFIVPSILRRGDLMIAVSTSGSSPALSKRIRRELEDLYGEEYGPYIDLLGEMRTLVKGKYASQREREDVFMRLLNKPEILELMRDGKPERARQLALSLV